MAKGRALPKVTSLVAGGIVNGVSTVNFDRASVSGPAIPASAEITSGWSTLSTGPDDVLSFFLSYYQEHLSSSLTRKHENISTPFCSSSKLRSGKYIGIPFWGKNFGEELGANAQLCRNPGSTRICTNDNAWDSHSVHAVEHDTYAASSQKHSAQAPI